jgi:hypothetical protein
MIVKFLQQDAIGNIVVLSITKFNRQDYCLEKGRNVKMFLAFFKIT